MSKIKHPQRRRGRPGEASGAGVLRLYGLHAVSAALANPQREIRRLLATRNAAERLPPTTGRSAPRIVEPKELDALLPQDSVHQGLIAEVAPLPALAIEDVLQGAEPEAVLVVLDQVEDPQNVGAILRSAAAFGATAVIVQDRHAPPESGALAKAASGALERMPLVRVTNLARGLEQAKEAGFWCVGLAGEAADPIARARLDGRIAVILGAEGPGLRRLTRETCDALVRLPTGGPVASLNVSNAAAIALYEAARRRAQ